MSETPINQEPVDNESQESIVTDPPLTPGQITTENGVGLIPPLVIERNEIEIPSVLEPAEEKPDIEVNVAPLSSVEMVPVAEVDVPKNPNQVDTSVPSKVGAAGTAAILAAIAGKAVAKRLRR